VAAAEESPPAPPSRGWRVACVAGVPIHVRTSALVTLAVLWLLLHAQLAPGLTWRAWWLAPVVTTLTCLAFLLSVILHELAHALVARALRLPVTEVTVFHLGGVTRLGRDPEDPGEEALVAAAGPLLSVLLAGALLVAGARAGTTTVPGGTLVFLAYLNGTLGVFNLLPGHPLDGGALVRAGAWALTGDPARALRASGLLGQAIGAGLMLAGVLGALPGGPVPSDPAWLWVAVVGAFVAVGARVGVLHAGVRFRLAGMRARDLSRNVVFDLPDRVTIGTVVATVTSHAGPGLVLGRDGDAVGTFGPAEVASVPHGAWEHVTVAETMQPLVGVVDADAELLEVLPHFRRTRDSVLAVLSDGRPVATLAASDVLAHLEGV
jgi:Zn-dependent protease